MNLSAVEAINRVNESVTVEMRVQRTKSCTGSRQVFLDSEANHPKKHAHVRQQTAQKFADFLLSPEGQKVIADFGTDRYGQPLFFVGEPDTGKN